MYKKIYKELLQSYGPRGWWPVTPPGEASPCYIGGPQSESQRFEVMLGTVLTQNTSWNNAALAISALNQEELMQPEALLAAPYSKLAQTIKASGYYNQKAKTLRHLALFLKDHPLSALMEMKAVFLRERLLQVHGVGPETADSILLYALDKPVFVVDAYTRRIFTRLGAVPSGLSYDQIQALFQANLPRNARVYNEYHALIVEHAKRACLKRPKCGGCCVEKLCAKVGEC